MGRKPTTLVMGVRQIRFYYTTFTCVFQKRNGIFLFIVKTIIFLAKNTTHRLTIVTVAITHTANTRIGVQNPSVVRV